MKAKSLVIIVSSLFTVILVLFVSLFWAFTEGRKSGLKHGFVHGQVKLLNLLSNETGAFPQNSDMKDYRKIYGTKTFSVFVHKDETARHIIVTGQY